MHISLTPEQEDRIKNKVEPGLYNNASEVIREAPRFMDEHVLLVEQMKLDYLRREVAKGAEQAERGEFSTHTVDTLLEELNTQEPRTNCMNYRLKPEIRQAQKTDARSISNLLLQLGYDTALSKTEMLISKSLNGDNNIFVGLLNGSVVGVISFIYFDYFPSAEKFCRITAIVVDEEVRGSGVGSKLISHVKLKALAEKCNVLEVTTSLQREKTQAYYESISFQKTSYKYVQRLD